MKKLMSILTAVFTAFSVFGGTAVFGADAEYIPTLTVDMTNEDHDIIHGAAGFLYGISNEGVPDVNTLTPLKPKVLATKGALGTEHPYGDALDVADEFFEAGGQQVQMYNSNYYGVFGVTADAYEYGEVLKEIIAPAVAKWKDEHRSKYPDIDQRMVYIPINEGTPRNYNGGEATIMNSWKVYYEAIKSADPGALIAGPNNSEYSPNYGRMRDFLTFCRDNDCLPDIVTWHELGVICLNTMNSHIADYRNICRDLGIEERQVVINEYADYADCGVPGRLVNWIARLEDNQVYGCLPFWHQANNLNDLAANQNQGNGAWQLYNWYGNMSGRTLKVTPSNTTYDQLYGLASIDSVKKSADVIFGGSDGKIKVRLDNISRTEAFRNAEKVHIKVEAAYYSGYHGAANDTDTVLEGTFTLDNGSVEIEFEGCKFSTAYRINVTEAAEGENIVPVKGACRMEYEAEEASFYGNVNVDYQSSVYPPYYFSGGQRVGNFNNEGDAIEYSIEVPYDGKYKLEFIYGNGVGETRNNMYTHKPLNMMHKLIVDRSDEYELELPNTLFYAMEGKVEKHLDLTAGVHRIRLEYGDLAGGYQDALYVSYAGAYGEDVPLYTKIYEAEAADFNLFSGGSAVVTETEIENYSANGYVTGLEQIPVENGGGIRWITSVEKSGMYHLSFRFNTENNGEIRVFKDNTNLTYTNFLASIPYEAKNGWQTAHMTAYFKKGINIIDIDTTSAVNMDYMKLTEMKDGDSLSVKYEAEDGLGVEQTAVARGNEVYVPEMLGSKNARDTKGEYIELTINAPAAGEYRMQVFQSNDDLCGSHFYNIKIIDRYASFELNGDEENAPMYFFPNSFSDDSFIETTVPLTLEEGENKLRIYNNDSKETLWGGTTGTPGENVLVNYTPNFESFVLWPATADCGLEASHELYVSCTNGGNAYWNKNTAEDGGSAVLTLMPEGLITSLIVNGEDVTDKLETNDKNIYTYTVNEVFDNIKAEVCFSEALIIPSEGENDGRTVEYNGVVYSFASENMFTNGDFKDNSGGNMELWYRGVNTNGHNGVDASIPNPKTGENLVPLNSGNALITGMYEPSNRPSNTFYFGKDGSREYLVENIGFPWETNTWNGEHSLMAFVPIKPDTEYYFTFEAYTLSGKASVRYGAIDSENFAAVPYSTADGLNFSGTGYMDCTNGDMQNVGGAWRTYEAVIHSGETADYFMYNAYWLQMCDYLCTGNFKLYELEPAETEVISVESLAPVEVNVGEAVTLPEKIDGITENGEEQFSVQWSNAESIDTSSAGVYIVSGEVIFPAGYYGSKYVRNVKIRVIVSENKPLGIWNIKAENGKLTFNVSAESENYTVYTAFYSENTLIKAEKGGSFEKEIPENCDEAAIYVWKDLKPLFKCVKIKVNQGGENNV